MSDIEQLEIDFDTWFNREFSDHKANWTINEYASAKTAAWKSWQAAKQDVQVDAKDLLEEVKQLCRDYSSRTNSVYVGDVLAQLDHLYERLAQPPVEKQS